MPIQRKPSPDLASRPAPSTRERAEWVLEFLRRDVGDLSPGEVIDLRDDIIRFRHGTIEVESFDLDELHALFPWDFKPAQQEGVEKSATSDPSRPVIAATRELATGLQVRLREGVAALEADGRWEPFATNKPAPHWSIHLRSDGTFERRYTGRQATVFLASAVDCLLEWWPELRRCKHEACNALFLPRHGRQRYHASSCRQANFRYRERARSRPSPVRSAGAAAVLTETPAPASMDPSRVL